jgi:hypothetical protein
MATTITVANRIELMCAFSTLEIGDYFYKINGAVLQTCQKLWADAQNNNAWNCVTCTAIQMQDVDIIVPIREVLISATKV